MSEIEQVQLAIDGMVKECIESDDALNCMSDAIAIMPAAEGGDLCIPKIVLLTSEDCTHCDDAKLKYREYIEHDRIAVVDVDGAEGREIVDKVNADHVPALLVLDCNNGLIGEVYAGDELDPITPAT